MTRSTPERQISPDGKKVAFARDYNLWVQDVETRKEHALTTDGEYGYAYATSPITWGMPLNTDLQACWSPDSRILFTVQTDNRQVKRTPVIDYVPEDGAIRSTVTEYPCGYAGDEHMEEQRILAISIETGMQQGANYHPVPVNRSAFGLFTDNLGWWSNDSRHAYFVDLERGYQTARVVEFDTHTGATRILFEETSKTYLNLSPNETTPATSLPLPDSQELIWFSERSGWAHLYLYDLDTGNLKHPITQGAWLVREILHFDSEHRELFFQAGGRVTNRDPYYLDICRVNIDTGKITALTNSDHEYTVFGSLGPRTTISFMGSFSDPDALINTSGISPDASYVVATRSRADEAPVTILIDREGKPLLEVEKADVYGVPDGWQWPEPVELLAADGETDIYGVVFRPSDFSPDKSYAVIDYTLCIAEFSSVSKGSLSNAVAGGMFYLQAAALAELGFIVVTIDGRGTAYRDRAFADTSYGWMPSASDAEDRIDGIKQLAKRFPYMDLDCVGIIGVSGTVGAVYGLLEHPEFYQVGVSHAFMDSRIIATVCKEQYEELGPAKNHHKHAEQQVDKLQGKLLLMHGLQDTITHVAATYRLVDALQQANKDFDMLVLPNEPGAKSGAHISSFYAFRRTWDYFVKHLLGVEPPKEFNPGAACV